MYPAMYMGMWLMVLLPVCCTPFGAAYNPECARRCDKDIVVVEGFENDEHCPISMPDNPYRHGDDNSGDILPCQIGIHSNCSNYCRIELYFTKFDLTPCSSNMTIAPEACDMVDGCEYILLHEKGATLDGTNINHVTTFHGNHTDEIFVSQTDKVVLQLCYRSETFSARNIQITFGFIDPTRTPLSYRVPLLVYIMGGVVIFLAMCICIIMWYPTLMKSLDPPPEQKQSREEYL